MSMDDSFRGVARQAFVIIAGLCIHGCGSLPTDLPVVVGGQPLAATAPGYRSTLQIGYLGSGGVVLKRGEDTVITAPFFSNPPLLQVALGTIESNPAEVDRQLVGLEREIASTGAVLIGHAHYDHVMDLPYVQRRYLKGAKFYGSETARRILMTYPEFTPENLPPVEHLAGDATAAGTWVPVGSRVRFMALRSAHAPILSGIKFAHGTYEARLPRPPTRSYEWRDGLTLAFVVDFLGEDGKSIDYRVYYQDAATTPPVGFPPRAVLADSPAVTVAILCVPGFDQETGYPEGILDLLRPHTLVGIHWENFFQRIPEDMRDIRTVPLLDGAGFVEHVRRVPGQPAEFIAPTPGAWTVVHPEGDRRTRASLPAGSATPRR